MDCVCGGYNFSNGKCKKVCKNPEYQTLQECQDDNNPEIVIRYNYIPSNTVGQAGKCKGFYQFGDYTTAIECVLDNTRTIPGKGTWFVDEPSRTETFYVDGFGIVIVPIEGRRYEFESETTIIGIDKEEQIIQEGVRYIELAWNNPQLNGTPGMFIDVKHAVYQLTPITDPPGGSSSQNFSEGSSYSPEYWTVWNQTLPSGQVSNARLVATQPSISWGFTNEPPETLTPAVEPPDGDPPPNPDPPEEEDPDQTKRKVYIFDNDTEKKIDEFLIEEEYTVFNNFAKKDKSYSTLKLGDDVNEYCEIRTFKNKGDKKVFRHGAVINSNEDNLEAPFAHDYKKNPNDELNPHYEILANPWTNILKANHDTFEYEIATIDPLQLIDNKPLEEQILVKDCKNVEVKIKRLFMENGQAKVTEKETRKIKIKKIPLPPNTPLDKVKIEAVSYTIR